MRKTTTSDRLPPIPVDKMTPEQKRASQEFESGRGYAPRGPFAVMLRSPEVMLRAKAMGDYLRFRNVLPAPIRELAILVTAREWSQDYEWFHHYRIALKEGLAAEIADAVADGRRPEAMSEAEAAAYDFSIELHRRRSVSDATYARALGQFGEQGIIDLVGLNGYYSLNAMMMNVARTPLPDEKEAEPLPRFPD
jgi:4-carboxymuconolactone decarboxylase